MKKIEYLEKIKIYIAEVIKNLEKISDDDLDDSIDDINDLSIILNDVINVIKKKERKLRFIEKNKITEDKKD